MRTHLHDAVDRGDWMAATETAEDLSYLCREGGRLAEALALAEQMADYTRRARLGPWTQLSDEARRLQILSLMGQARQVLDQVLRLRKQMQALPAVSLREAVAPWDASESLLRAGRDSALRLDRWDVALDLNAAIISSQRKRGARALGIAQDRFNDFSPLLRLGRFDDALALLRDCRQAFEDAHEPHLLGYTLGALAELEATRGHGDVAIRLQQDCLRYSYLANEAVNIAVSHRNLGNYLEFARQPAAALDHHLADALILALAGTGDAYESVRAAASDLRALGAGAPVPADVPDLCRRVAAVPGVNLERLLVTLAPDPHVAPQALQALTARARDLAAAPPNAIAGYLAAWDPVIAAILAAVGGDVAAAAALDEELSGYQDSADWSALVAAMRRLRAGETGLESLAGLDEVHAAIVTRALGARRGSVLIPPGLWPAMGLGPLLCDLVNGAAGDIEAAGRAREFLEEMARVPERVLLANALGSILDGNRAAALATRFTNPTHTAVVIIVLRHISR